MSEKPDLRAEAHAACPCRSLYLLYACGPIWCECRPNVATTTSTVQTPVIGTHPCLWPGHAAINSLADDRDRLERERFGEHVLAQEWQGRAEAAERERQRDEMRRGHEQPLCPLCAAERDRDNLSKTISGVLCDAANIPVPGDCADPVAVDKALRQMLDDRDKAAARARALAKVLDVIANITEAPHWETKRRWDIGMKARAALAEKEVGGE